MPARQVRRRRAEEAERTIAEVRAEAAMKAETRDLTEVLAAARVPTAEALGVKAVMEERVMEGKETMAVAVRAPLRA
jgi:hypothetical protein